MSRADMVRFRVRIRAWDKHQREMRGEGKRRRGRDWIALSTDITRDPQVIALTCEQRWLWVAMLAHAGRVGPEFETSVATARVLFLLRPGWRAATDLGALAQHGFIELEMSGEPGFTAQKPTRTAKKRAKKAPPPPQYPEGLNVTAWKMFEQYRRDNRLRTYKPKYAKQAMNHWSRFSMEIQLAAVNQTIANNWQGVFPEKLVKNQPDTDEQKADRNRADLADMARVLGINQRPDEDRAAFEARVVAANNKRIANLGKR